MKNLINTALCIITGIVLSAAATAQASRPAEFVLWPESATEATSKRLDAFLELVAERADLVQDVLALGVSAKLEFDNSKKRALLLLAHEKILKVEKIEAGAAFKAGIEEFGLKVDTDVFVFYAGAIKIKKNAFLDPEVSSSFLYYNRGDRDIVGIKLTSITLVDCFGDKTEISGNGALTGTKSGAVDAFESPRTPSSILADPRTGRISAIELRIVYKAKPKSGKDV